jgi:large subunit ribosomal protein L21
MKAILEIGGKQVLVGPGSVVRTEKLDYKEGDSFEIDKVLCVYSEEKTLLGKPHVNGAKVKFTVKDSIKGRKILIRTYKRRKAEKRTLGHRQLHTVLKVDDIIAG